MSKKEKLSERPYYLEDGKEPFCENFEELYRLKEEWKDYAESLEAKIEKLKELVISMRKSYDMSYHKLTDEQFVLLEELTQTKDDLSNF